MLAKNIDGYQPRKNRLRYNKAMLELDSLTGWSYDWWAICRRINGKLVFNWAKYSNTTNSHQRLISSWLSSLGKRIDLSIECPTGLQDSNWAKSSVRHYADSIAYLEALNAYGNKPNNARRNVLIKSYCNKIEAIRKLEYISRKELGNIRVYAETMAKQRVERERQDRKDKKVQKIVKLLLGK